MTQYTDKPVFITGAPRSGTSIVAGILSSHNIWSGNTQQADKNNKKGYFENLQLRNNIIKPILHQMGGDMLGVSNLPPIERAQPIPNLKSITLDIISSQGYLMNSLWLLKEPKLTLVWPTFHAAFPDATWVIVKRNKEDIVRSCLKTDFMSQHSQDHEYWINFVNEYEDRLQQLSETAHSVEIWPSRLINNNLSELELIAEKLGFEVNHDLVSEFIQQEYWTSHS